jgi:hypothetical protein
VLVGLAVGLRVGVLVRVAVGKAVGALLGVAVGAKALVGVLGGVAVATRATCTACSVSVGFAVVGALSSQAASSTARTTDMPNAPIALASLVVGASNSLAHQSRYRSAAVQTVIGMLLVYPFDSSLSNFAWESSVILPGLTHSRHRTTSMIFQILHGLCGLGNSDG